MVFSYLVLALVVPPVGLLVVVDAWLILDYSDEGLSSTPRCVYG